MVASFAPDRRSQWRLPLVIAVAILALISRMWAVDSLSSDIRISDPVLDAAYYLDLAKDVAQQGHWPSEPLFFGPFYPWLLSLLFRVAPATPLTVQIIQSILGIAAMAILFAAVRKHFGRTAAAAAAILYLATGPILAMENLVLMESVLLFLATLALWLWPGPGRRTSTHLLFGITCGLMAVARATFLLLPLVAIAALMLEKRGRRQTKTAAMRSGRDAAPQKDQTERNVPHVSPLARKRIPFATESETEAAQPATAPRNQAGSRQVTPITMRVRPQPSTVLLVALIILGVIVPLIPQTIHQTRATRRFEVFTLNGGMNLYIGNNPLARGISSAPPGLDLNEDVTGRRSASNLAGRALTLDESSRFWRERALDFIRSDSGRALWLFGRKALLFFSPAEIPQVYNFSSLKDIALPLKLAFINFAWIFPLAIVGVLAAVMGARDARRRSAAGRRGKSKEHPPATSRTTSTQATLQISGRSIIPYVALIATGWVQVIIFFATGRYRIPVMPGFLGLAGLGVAYSIGEIRRRRFVPAAIAVAGIVIMHLIPPGYPVARARAFDDYYLAQRYAQKGEPDKALEEYRAAAELAPDFGEAWHGMGAVLYSEGRLPEAAQAFEAALQRMPQSAITYYALGAVYYQLDEFDKAIESLQTAVRLNPRRPDYHFDLGNALARVGRTQEAAQEWQITLQLDPTHEGARQNLRRLQGGAGQAGP